MLLWYRYFDIRNTRHVFHVGEEIAALHAAITFQFLF